MEILTPDRIRNDLPRPIAWAYSEYAKARDAVSRFHLLLELAEETLHYLTVIDLARYLELRPERPDERVDADIRRLQQPSMGDWVTALERLENYFKTTAAEKPLGTALNDSGEWKEMLSVCVLGEPSNRRSVSPIGFFKALTTIRNRTKGHGNVSEAQASKYVQPLDAALIELCSAIPALTAQRPTCVRRILFSKKRYFVDVDPLVGTGRPNTHTLELPSPGVLEDGCVFLWDEGGTSPPLKLTPLVAVDGDILLVFAGAPRGLPQYSSPELGNKPPHQPDNIVSEFTQLAGILLEQREPVVTAARPAGAYETYERVVAQAIDDGKVTTDEYGMLEVMRANLGLSEEERRAIHDKYGVEARLVRPVSTAPSTKRPSVAAQPVQSAQRPATKPPVVAVEPPDQNSAARQAAHALDMADDLDGAIAAYREILAKDPGDVKARAELVTLLVDVSAYVDAERECRVGLELRDSALLRARLAYVHQNQARTDEALSEVETALKLDPTCAYAHYVHSGSLAMDGNDDQALAAIDRALAIEPKNLRFVLARVTRDAANVPPAEALRLASAAVQQEPKNRDLSAYRILAFLGAGLAAEAVEEGGRLVQRNPRDATAVAWLAMAQFSAGQIDAALANTRRALLLHPNQVSALCIQAWIELSRGAIDAVATIVDNLMHNRPGLWEARELHIALLKAQGNQAAAIAEARKGVLLTQDSVRALVQLSAVLEWAGKLPDAERVARQAVERSPQSSAARSQLAAVLTNLGRRTDASQLIAGLPRNIDTRMLELRSEIAQGNWKAAESLAREVCDLSPGYRDAWDYLLIVYGSLGLLDSSRKAFAGHPLKDDEARFWYARALAACGEHAEAAQLLETVDGERINWSTAFDVASSIGRQDLMRRFAERGVAREPEAAWSHFNLGLVLDNEGNANDALAEYQRALAFDPSFTIALNNTAVLLDKLGRPGEALEYLRRAAVTDGGKNDVRTRLNMAECLVALGRTEEAIREADAALGDPPNEDLVIEWAERLRSNRLLEHARKKLEACLAGRPESVGLRLSLAGVLHDLGDNERAKKILAEAAALSPRNAVILSHMGFQLYHEGRKAQALDWFRRSAAAAPDDVDIQARYAQALILAGADEKASEIFERLLGQASDKNETINRWLWGYLDAGRGADGLDMARSLRERWPESAAARGFEGRFLDALGKHEDALHILEACERESPDAAFAIGVCLKHMDRWQQAIDVFQRALDVWPDNPDIYRELFDCLVTVGQREWATDVLENHILRLQPRARDADALRAKLSPPPESLN
jgi:tetratricopeptide (TPR) repeat protein